MKFLMLVCRDTEPPPVPPSDIGDDVDTWVTSMGDRGLRITGAPVAPQDEAKSVRVRDGQILVTDGPFAETKEVLAGFDLLECRDMAEAIEVAAAHPFARRGVMDIRRLLDD